MIDLLQHYSLSDIVLFIVFLSVAVKGFITFFDWATTRLKEHFNIEFKKDIEKKEQEQKMHQIEQAIQELRQSQKKQNEILQTLSHKIGVLIDSDRDDIKAFITEKHHFYCYQQGWIDDFNMECLEKRYEHYADEGGNSFIGGFMKELRKLPKRHLQV